MFDGLTTTDSRAFDAATVLSYGIPELLSSDCVRVDDVSKVIGISRQSVIAIRDISPFDAPVLCRKIAARKAAKLAIEYQKVVEIAKVLTECNEFQLSKLRRKIEEDLSKLSSGQISFHQMLAARFMAHIGQVMFDAEASDWAAVSKMPSSLFVTMQQMKQGMMPVFCRLLVAHKAIDIVVNNVALDTSIASTHATVRGRKLVHDLIRAGANLAFIEKYNDQRSVDVEYYRNWRRLHDVNTSHEKISLCEGVDIYQLYNTLMKTNMLTIDIYFELHRRFKYRIETLYNYINTTIADLNEEEEDEENELFGEVAALINQKLP